MRLCVDARCVVAGEVKARCGTSFYKNVCYPFVKMYDPEDSHNLSIKVTLLPKGEKGNRIKRIIGRFLHL